MFADKVLRQGVSQKARRHRTWGKEWEGLINNLSLAELYDFTYIQSSQDHIGEINFSNHSNLWFESKSDRGYIGFHILISGTTMVIKSIEEIYGMIIMYPVELQVSLVDSASVRSEYFTDDEDIPLSPLFCNIKRVLAAMSLNQAGQINLHSADISSKGNKLRRSRGLPEASKYHVFLPESTYKEQSGTFLDTIASSISPKYYIRDVGQWMKKEKIDKRISSR